MKIAIVLPVFLSGGAESMATQLACYLKRNGQNVEVISIYPRQDHVYEQKLEDEGITVHYVDKRSSKSPRAMLRLWKTLSAMKPDIVHAHMSAAVYALPWCFVHGIKLVRTIHTMPSSETNIRKFYRIFEKLGVIRPVTISRANQLEACEIYRATAEEYPCIINPVETARFARREEPEEGRMNYICVGRLDENKNQILAIRAMPAVLEQIPTAKLWLLGEGEERENLLREAEKLGVSHAVELTGNQPRPEDFLARSDVYLMVSHVEGLPLSVLEAMAAGLPVIGTKVGGVPDLIRDNGCLIGDDDLEALVREMLRFGKDGSLRESFGEKSREMAKNYDADTCAKEYIRLYEKILEKG